MKFTPVIVTSLCIPSGFALPLQASEPIKVHSTEPIPIGQAVAYTDLAPKTIKLGANAVIDSIKNTLTKELDWSALNGRGKPIEVDGGYPTQEIR